MVVISALMIGFLAYEGHHEPIVLGVAAALGVVGIALILWARSGAAAEAARLKSAGAARDNRLAGVQAEADRLRGELTRALAQQREAEEGARAAATAAAAGQKQQEAAIREGRAESERLRKELETARRQAQARAPESPVAPSAAAPAPAAPPPPPKPAAPAPRPASVPAPPPRPSPPPAPVVEPVAAAPPPTPAPPMGKREPDPAPGDARGTVLLVDDEASFLFVAGNILRPAGFRVIEAENGQAALDQAGQQTGKIDLLITDMMMPGMSGRQLAQRFTKLRPGVRVLYVSGFVDEGSAREAIEGEEADFLAKPFEVDAFTTMVRELIGAASR